MTALPTALAEPVQLAKVLPVGRGPAAPAVLRANGAYAVVGLDPTTVPLVAPAAVERTIAAVSLNVAARFVDVAAARTWT